MTRSIQIHPSKFTLDLFRHARIFLKALRQSWVSPSIQTAEPRLFLYQLRPYVPPGASDRRRTPAGPGPFVRREHNTGRDGSERLESWGSVRAPAGIPEGISPIHAAPRRGYPAASGRRREFRPKRWIFSAATPPSGNLRWSVRGASLSIDLPRNSTGQARYPASVQSSGETAG